MVYFKRFEDIFYIIYRVGGNSGTLMDRKHKITEVKTSSCQPNLFAIIKINPKGFLGSRYQKQLCSQDFLHISVTPKKNWIFSSKAGVFHVDFVLFVHKKRRYLTKYAIPKHTDIDMHMSTCMYVRMYISRVITILVNVSPTVCTTKYG